MFKVFDSLGQLQNCETQCSCSNKFSENVIGHLKNIANSSDCRDECASTAECQYYTYYNNKTGTKLTINYLC